MLTIVQKVGPKFQVTIAKRVRETLGLKIGDLVETSIARDGAIVVRPVELRPRPPVGRIGKVDIKRRLEEADQAAADGRVLGPFTSARSAMHTLKQLTRARRSY